MAKNKKPRKPYRPKYVINPLSIHVNEEESKQYVVNAVEDLFESFKESPTADVWMDMVTHLKYARVIAVRFEEYEAIITSIDDSLRALISIFEDGPNSEKFKLCERTEPIIRLGMDYANAMFQASEPEDIRDIYQALINATNKLKKKTLTLPRASAAYTRGVLEGYSMLTDAKEFKAVVRRA